MEGTNELKGNNTSGMEDMVVLRELSRTQSSSRKDLLFKHVITQDKDQSMLNAYTVKRKIAENFPKVEEGYRIGSTDPIILIPEGKYNHCRGARINSITLTRKQIMVSLICVHFVYTYCCYFSKIIFYLLYYLLFACRTKPQKRKRPRPRHIKKFHPSLTN